jgi:hypothetical protein
VRCRRRHRRRRVKCAKCRRRRRLEETLGEREDARASEARRDLDRTLEAAKRREVARDRRGEEVGRTADRTVGRTAEADRTVVAAVVEARLAEDGTPVAIRARVRPRGIEVAAGDTTAIAIESDDLLFLNVVEGFNIKVSQLNNDDKHLNIFLFYSSADLFKRARSIACLMNTFVSSVNGMSVRSDIVRRTSSI